MHLSCTGAPQLHVEGAVHKNLLSAGGSSRAGGEPGPSLTASGAILKVAVAAGRWEGTETNSFLASHSPGPALLMLGQWGV